jgi:hypothetical protein
MFKVAIAFAVGAVAGGLFVKWYVENNAARIVGEKVAGALGVDPTSTTGKTIVGLAGLVDEVRN